MTIRFVTNAVEGEKIKWKNGTQDSNLEIYGDRYSVDRTGAIAFVHFSNIEEMIDFINQENFEIIEYKKSTDIVEENEKTKEFVNFLNTLFFILAALPLRT